MSSWLLMGLPGVAYLTGVADAAWTAIGLAIGTYINWLIVAKRIRMYSQGYDAFTVPDFFSKRFGGCKTLSCIAAIMIVVFSFPYTASGLQHAVNYFQAFWCQLSSRNGYKCCCNRMLLYIRGFPCCKLQQTLFRALLCL